MTFVEAIKVSVWVRRRGSSRWTLVPKNGEPIKIGREDLVAEDWEPYHWIEPDDRHPSVIRFSLLELK